MTSFAEESYRLWKASQSVRSASPSAAALSQHILKQSNAYSDDSSTIASDQFSDDDCSVLGSEHLSDKEQSSEMLSEISQEAKSDAAMQQRILSYTVSQISGEIQPTFAQRADGSFVMELPCAHVKINTNWLCDEAWSTGTDFQPRKEVSVVLPELERVVFDPLARTPVGMCMTASAHKCVKVLEVPHGHKLDSKICAKPASGSLILKDVLYTNGCRQAAADVALNFELTIHGHTSVCHHQLMLEVDFVCRCWLSDSALGYSLDGEWWGLLVTGPQLEIADPSSLATSSPDVITCSPTAETRDELDDMEHQAAEIHAELSRTNSCAMSPSCLASLKSTLARLELQAEQSR
jgi:hypothetical protein